MHLMRSEIETVLNGKIKNQRKVGDWVVWDFTGSVEDGIRFKDGWNRYCTGLFFNQEQMRIGIISDNFVDDIKAERQQIIFKEKELRRMGVL